MRNRLSDGGVPAGCAELQILGFMGMMRLARPPSGRRLTNGCPGAACFGPRAVPIFTIGQSPTWQSPFAPGWDAQGSRIRGKGLATLGLFEGRPCWAAQGAGDAAKCMCPRMSAPVSARRGKAEADSPPLAACAGTIRPCCETGKRGDRLLQPSLGMIAPGAKRSQGRRGGLMRADADSRCGRTFEADGDSGGEPRPGAASAGIPLVPRRLNQCPPGRSAGNRRRHRRAWQQHMASGP